MIASIEKTSYVPGEIFRLHLPWDHPDIAAADVGNMSTDIFRIKIGRNALALGFGTTPVVQNGELVLQVHLPNTLSSGLHTVASTHVTEINGQQLEQPLLVRFEPIFFEVREHFRQPVSIEELALRLDELSISREKYINKVHVTDEASGDSKTDKFFAVVVFGVGCLIHISQQLEGFRIDPIGHGLSHKRFLELVNTYLEHEQCEGLPFLEKTESQFEQSTPTIAVTFPRVQARDHRDALDHCRAHSGQIFQLLGMEQGQIPREFAYLAMEHGTTNRWHGFEMPGYRGNLILDFNPTQLAESIEKRLPKLQTNPFARLLVRSYAEATGERDFGFRILRYWTVLELAADRSISGGQPISNPDGSPILNPKGKPETTRSKRGRVYEYVLRGGSFASMSTHRVGSKGITLIIGDKSDKRFKPGMVVVTLWEMVQAIYAIRCAVAHEGFFDPAKRSSPGEILASDFLARGYPNLLEFVASQARSAIWRDG